MSEATGYDVRTIVGIARLPEDAFDRFLREFPIMVETIRGHIVLLEGLNQLAGAEPLTDAQMLEAIHGLRWIDDDKGNVSINISAQDASGGKVRIAEVQANHKTGAFSAKVDFPPASADERAELDPKDASAIGAAEMPKASPTNPISGEA